LCCQAQPDKRHKRCTGSTHTRLTSTSTAADLLFAARVKQLAGASLRIETEQDEPRALTNCARPAIEQQLG
jgi:hypothetical protein